MNESDLKEHITAAKDEIIAEIRKDKVERGQPSKNTQTISRRRGPQNTRMMKVERREVVTYLEIDCHRTVDSCTPADCLHVWNLPENKSAFDRASHRSDSARGYADYNALYAGVMHYHEKDILLKQRKKAGIYTK